MVLRRLSTLLLPPIPRATTNRCRTRLLPVVDTLRWTAVMVTKRDTMESVPQRVGYVYPLHSTLVPSYQLGERVGWILWIFY